MSKSVRRFITISIVFVFVVLTNTACSLEWFVRLPINSPSVKMVALPEELYSTSQLSVSVDGDYVVSYRYKMGLASTVDCGSPEGYSEPVPVRSLITQANISGYAEQEVVVCVVAISSRGEQQGYDRASKMTLFVDSAPNMISIQEHEQSAWETDGSLKAFTITSAVAKPYPLTINYEIQGDSVSGLDHNLPMAGSVVIPAGQTSVTLPFSLYPNPFSVEHKEVRLVLKSSSRATARLEDNRLSRFLIYDVDGGARATVVSYSMNQYTTCVVLSDGVLKCWGGNTGGQIGDGTTINRTAPVAIDAGTSYASVYVGSSTTCAITTTGVLKCWGSNSNYQFGNGTTTDSYTPVVVDAGTAYASIAVGSTMCGITTGDVLKCWGANASGQIGDNSTVTKTAPTAIGGALRFKSVTLATNSGGSTTTCAITDTSALYCWGANGSGQIGDGSTSTRLTPTLITSGTSYTKVTTVGYNTCALTTGGALRCWGSGTNGLVGDGTSTQRLSPTTIDATETYANFSLQYENGCGVTVGGVVKCWGLNGNGQVGNNSTTTATAPTAISDSDSYTDVFNGSLSVCAVTTTNALKCWGYNGAGQIGDGTLVDRKTPVLVDAGVSYTDAKIAGNSSNVMYNICARTLANGLKCWGSNNLGQVGDATNTGRLSPAGVDAGVSYAKVASANGASCGITTSGLLKCWGSNSRSQLGDGTNTNRRSPGVVDAGNRFKDLVMAGSTVLAITTDGTLKGWGANEAGQLGIGTTSDSRTPVVIDSANKYKQISYTQGSATCGITTTNILRCWGTNNNGQAGVGNTTNVLNPTTIDAGTNYKLVQASGSTCAITEDDVLKCWGASASGQVGYGGGGNVTSPTIIDAGTAYKSVSLNASTTCGITTADVLKCWGYNAFGSVGNSSTTNALSPVVINSGTSYSWVSVGSYTTCAQTTGNVLKCW